jgi:hypothetical protein
MFASGGPPQLIHFATTACARQTRAPASEFKYYAGQRRNTQQSLGTSNRKYNNSTNNMMTLAGLEPAIFGSEDQRLIH